MSKLRVLPFLSVLALAGCHSAATPDPTPSTAVGQKGTTGTERGPENAAAVPSTTTGTTPEATPATPSPSAPSGPAPTEGQVPDTLKTDGYHYYGLGYSKPMNLEISISDQPNSTVSGTQTISLKEIKDGVPTYKIERTGPLAKLGAQEVELKPDGIYNTASTVAKVSAKDLEMPAKLTPGSTWKSHTEVDQGTTKMVNDSVFKVGGIEKVQTKAGEHEGLVITSTGVGTVGDKKVHTTSKSWYVKDLGGVKTVLNTTGADGKVQVITIQEIK